MKAQNRVFYLNVILACNNKCLFCLSPSTYNGIEGLMCVEDVNNIIKSYNIDYGDRVIINGGEPMLHPNIEEILIAFKETSAELVMYSNGVFLKYDKNIEILKKSSVNRITIPLHGDINTHNFITYSNSFNSTIESINKLLNIKDSTLNVELKFILNDYYIKNNISINKLIKNNIDYSKLKNLVIAGLVENSISRKNGVTISWNKMGKYLSEEILLIKNNMPNLLIKFEDIAFCKMSEFYQRDIKERYNPTLNKSFGEFYVFDYKHKRGRNISYKEDFCILKGSDCYCDYFKFCSSIMKNYCVLCDDGKNIYRDME